MKQAPALAAVLILASIGSHVRAQAQPDVKNDVKNAVTSIVQLELLRHTEVYDRIHHQGKPSVLVVTGGTEERGPHDVLGGHTIMAHRRAVEIARRLGNALVAPVLPIAVAATGLREDT